MGPDAKTATSRLLTCIITGLMGATLAGWGQEALRQSITSEGAARARRKSLGQPDYNLKVGSMSFRFDTSLSVELNDNVDLRQQDPQADVIVSPGFTTRGHWPLTTSQALDFSVGVAYRKYCSQSRYDQLYVTPDTAVSFDLYVKNLRFNFYDRVSYTTDPLAAGAVSGVAEYGGLQNVVGFDVDWDLNKIILSVGYGHLNWMSAGSAYDYQNRAAELFYARALFQPDRPLSPGLEATCGLTRYDVQLLHDSLSFSAGPMIRWTLSRYVGLTAHVGYVAYNFQGDDEPGGSSDVSTWYLDVEINHALNRYFTHSLRVRREIQLGIYSDYLDIFSLGYQLTWNALKDVGLSVGLMYEYGQEPMFSVTSGTSVIYHLGETWDRVGLTIGASYPLARHLSAQVAYRYYVKASDNAVYDYSQNALTFSALYRF